MSETEVARATVQVRPLRFTGHLPEMQQFLALLGYSTGTSRDVRWTTMVGASGEVALHDAAVSQSQSPSGRTDLVFEVDRAEPLATQFVVAGLEHVDIYDEACGRVLTVQDGETGLYFDERPDDYYGLEVNDPQPQHGIASMPVLYGPPTGPLDRLLSAAGLVRADEGDDQSWRVWSAAGGGLVARHASGVGVVPGTVRLGFRTHEPLADLARRLTDAGYPDVALTERFGGELTVTDPDGESVLVQAARED
jgi:hypothetical protein